MKNRYPLLISGFVVFLFVFFLPKASNAEAPLAGIFSRDGSRLATLSKVIPGSSVAVGDINADGIQEIVIGSPPGVTPRIDIYEHNGNFIRFIEVFDKKLRSGLNVTVGDVLNDDTNEIIVAPRAGGGPHVLVLNPIGGVLTSFFPFSASFKGGVNIATGQLSGDGKQEILTGMGYGGSNISYFSGYGELLGTYAPYGKSTTGKAKHGVGVSAADWDGDGYDDIFISPQPKLFEVDKIWGGFTYSTIYSVHKRIGLTDDLNVGRGTSIATVKVRDTQFLTIGNFELSAASATQWQMNPPTPMVNRTETITPFPGWWLGGATAAGIDFDQTGDPEFVVIPGSTTLSAAELYLYVNRGALKPTFSGAYKSQKMSFKIRNGGSINANVVKINLADPEMHIYSSIRTTSPGAVSVADHVKSVDGFAGINGGIFCAEDKCGKDYWKAPLNSIPSWFDSQSQYYFEGEKNIHIGFDTRNQLSFSSPRDTKKFKEENQANPQAMFGTETLIRGRRPKRTAITPMSGAKVRQSAIGIRGREMYLVSANLPPRTMDQIMEMLDVEYASALDGGGSSALYVDGKYVNGPGRKVPTAIVFSNGKNKINFNQIPQVRKDKQYWQRVYAGNIVGGFTVASGNLLGDERNESIYGTTKGLGPEVKVISAKGTRIASFFAFPSNLRNGVSVASGDVSGDTYDEIITSQGSGAPPIVKVFSGTGEVINSGFSVLDGTFTGGVNVATGNVDGQGKTEILAAGKKGGNGVVYLYTSEGNAIAQFAPYGTSFQGGINIATADFEGDGVDEILTSQEYGAPLVKIFSLRDGLVHESAQSFFAFDAKSKGGISISRLDRDGDGKDEILVGAGVGSAPLVKIFSNKGKLLQQFYAFGINFTGGVNVSAGVYVNSTRKDEVIMIPRSKSNSEIIRAKPERIYLGVF